MLGQDNLDIGVVCVLSGQDKMINLKLPDRQSFQVKVERCVVYDYLTFHLGQGHNPLVFGPQFHFVTAAGFWVSLPLQYHSRLLLV